MKEEKNLRENIEYLKKIYEKDLQEELEEHNGELTDLSLEYKTIIMELEYALRISKE